MAGSLVPRENAQVGVDESYEEDGREAEDREAATDIALKALGQNDAVEWRKPRSDTSRLPELEAEGSRPER